MRITVRLDDGLLTPAKAEALQKQKTLTSLIEEGIRLVLSRAGTSVHRPRFVLSASRELGGVRPRVDLDDNAALLDVMEGRVASRK